MVLLDRSAIWTASSRKSGVYLLVGITLCLLVSWTGQPCWAPVQKLRGTSKETVSTTTDKALDSMADWRTRPLDPVYPVVFVDCVNVKIRMVRSRIVRSTCSWL
ncbi:transposase [Streptomyces sp. NBRC 110611]|uniref:transposase n=1 Tax=Streptomyces sp. NBRC 110611 TaxID=1621259 RepID=UPI0015EEE61C